MPKISTGKTVNLINNYMLRTLSVQKVVLADTTVDTTKKFTMALTVDGALYASKAFNIIGTSGLRRPAQPVRTEPSRLEPAKQQSLRMLPQSARPTVFWKHRMPPMFLSIRRQTPH
jgi:hypothetical protein